MRKRTVQGILVVMGLLAATAAHASQPQIPVPLESRRAIDPLWDASAPLVLTKEGAVGDTVWVRVKDDSSCSYTGSALFGGRGVNSPGWAVWCFDGGAGDSCSNTTKYGANSASNRIPGCWTHYDAHTFGSANRWHVDTYDVYQPGDEDSTMWCGELGDTLTWVSPPGYGHNYSYSLILNLGNSATFGTANGMTIGGVHLYSVELAYDYCFVEMCATGIVDTATWLEIARFNSISNPDSTNCRGLGPATWGTGPSGETGSPYLCADYTTFEIRVTPTQLSGIGQNGNENLMVRWRALSDLAWDDFDGSGGLTADTRGMWRVDHVYVKGANSGSSSYFPSGGAGARNPNDTSGNVDWETQGEDGRSAFTTPLLPLAEASGGYWNGMSSSWVHGKPRIVDLWHMTNTPLYPNQANTCETSNRWMWASNLTPGGVDGNIEDNAWNYRLVSPIINTTPTSPLTTGTILAGQRVTGNVVVYDNYLCIKQLADDVTDTQIRRYEGAPKNRWLDWEGDGFVLIGGCQFWNIGDFSDWSGKMTANTDSVQYSFDFFDQCNYNSNGPLECMPGVFLASPHRKNTYIVDNISVGFFEQTGTQWVADPQDLFQDTFARNVYVHPTTKENWELFPNDTRQDEDSMTVTVTDIDGIAENSIVMHYRVSTNCGSTWTHDNNAQHPQGSKAKPSQEWFTKTMNFSFPQFPANPPVNREFDGIYRTTLELNTADFPGSILSGSCPSCSLRVGTVIEYYFTANDRSVPAEPDTFPNRHSLRRNFIHSLYGAERQEEWPFEVTVLPCQPASAYTAQGGKRILLANEWYIRTVYDSESDRVLSGGLTVPNLPYLSQLFEESLRDLNLKFDRYDNNASQISRGTDTPFYTEPADADGFGGVRDPLTATNRYEAVIWATGTHNQYTVTDSSQLELSNYLATDANSGNLWLAGQNVCEDEKMSGTSEGFNGGSFWVNFVGASLLSGGCADNSGLTDRRFYVEGVNDALYTPFTLLGGWADCPIRDQPDNQMTVNAAGAGTETVVFQFDNVGHTLNTTAAIRNTQPGTPNKMITTLFDHGLITTRAARACLTRAILTDFGVTMPAGSKYTAGICANSATDIGETGSARKFDLEQNYPNPFNPSTKIRYSIPRDNMKVELEIFDVSGRRVVTLVNRVESGANHEVLWNGKNTAGQDVASGVYFYKLKADNQEAVKKMVLLK
jgi:hypothetical protein